MLLAALLHLFAAGLACSLARTLLLRLRFHCFANACVQENPQPASSFRMLKGGTGRKAPDDADASVVAAPVIAAPDSTKALVVDARF